MASDGFETNRKFAQLLRQMAALLDENGVAFKPAAYRRAAFVFDGLPVDMCEINDKKKFMEYPGVGDAIATKALEFIKTGHIKKLDQALAKRGGLSEELMLIEDLGPKRVRQIQELGIQTTPELIKAAEEGKLRDLPRFSETMEKKILENAGNVTERSHRFSLEEVKSDVEAVLRTIRSVSGVERAEIAGSYRRKKETVGDIDIVVITDKPEKISLAIASLPFVRKVVAHGGAKLSFDLQSGLRTDIRFVRAGQWGSALLYFTGSKEHNIVLRKLAIEKGWKLNEYGLFEGARIVAGKEEEDIYKALGLAWISPEKRTGELP